MNEGFQRTIEQLRADASSQAGKGRRFARLMKRYFQVDPHYVNEFSNVWLWSEWATEKPGFRLRPHQQTASDDVPKGLANHDRGKLVMACGTGKTFTALRIAEAVES